jgi:ABC-2 type transport system ATP-binding protein
LTSFMGSPVLGRIIERARRDTPAGEHLIHLNDANVAHRAGVSRSSRKGHRQPSAIPMAEDILTASDSVAHSQSPPLAVSVRDLRVRYGIIEAINGLDLDIPAGQLLALLGPNGAGKSTAVMCLLGLRKPTSGDLTVAGMAPAQAVRAGRVGAMLQVAGLPEGAKVREVVGLASALHRRRGCATDQLLEMTGLRELAARNVVALSGGQAQRVRFAVAIAGKPQVLILDEPTTGMDVETREVFWSAVRQLTKAGTTVVFTTHYLTEADKYADRIVMITRGRVVADGTAPELKAHLSSERIVELVTDHPDAVQALPTPQRTDVTIHGRKVQIRTHDPDGTLQALYTAGLSFCDVTIASGDLDEVLLAVSHDHEGI